MVMAHIAEEIDVRDYIDRDQFGDDSIESQDNPGRREWDTLTEHEREVRLERRRHRRSQPLKFVKGKNND